MGKPNGKTIIDDKFNLAIETPLYNFSTPWKVCDFCRHFNGDYQVPFLSCKAYPEGIPDELMIKLGKAGGHDGPLPGDNGIRFSPM